MSDHRTEPVFTVNYARLLKKHRRRALWLPLLFSVTGLLSVTLTLTDSGPLDWSVLLLEFIVVGFAWSYYWSFTMRDVEMVKMHGAALLIDGMAKELGREWRWSRKCQSFVLCDVDEDKHKDEER